MDFGSDIDLFRNDSDHLHTPLGPNDRVLDQAGLQGMVPRVNAPGHSLRS